MRAWREHTPPTNSQVSQKAEQSPVFLAVASTVVASNRRDILSCLDRCLYEKCCNEKPMFYWEKAYNIKKRKKRVECWVGMLMATSEYILQDSSFEDIHAKRYCFEVKTMVPMYHVQVHSLAI